MTKHILTYTIREKGCLHDKPAKENGKMPTKLGFPQEEKYNKAIHLQRVDYSKSQDMNWFPYRTHESKVIVLPVAVGFILAAFTSYYDYSSHRSVM